MSAKPAPGYAEGITMYSLRELEQDFITSSAVSSFSSSIPIISVALPPWRKPPVLAILVTLISFLTSSRISFRTSSFCTIANMSFINASI